MLKQTVLIVMLSLSIVSWASNDVFQFKHLTLEDGLSNSHVNCMVQDHEGFIWIGTENGLNRYDGYNFKHYYADVNDKTSLSSDEVFTLIVDKENVLWIGTFRGLHRYNAESDDFSQIVLHSNNINQSRKPILGLSLDDDDNLWIATSGNGVLNYNTKNNTYRTYLPNDKNKESISSAHLLSSFVDSKNQLFIGTATNGFSILNIEKQAFNNIDIANNIDNKEGQNAVLCFYELNRDSILVGTRNGLYCYDPYRNKISPFKYKNEAITQTANIAVHDIIKDNSNRLWISTKGEGLICINLTTDRLTRLRHDNSNPQNILNDNTRDLFEDKQGNIWAISYQSGINVLPNKIKIFQNYDLSDKASDSENKTVTAICYDKDHNLWIGTDGDGLKCLNRESNQLTQFKPSKTTSNTIPDKVIMSLHTDSKNNVWIGTYMQGLVKYNPNTKQFKNYRNIPNKNSLSNNYVSAIAEDDKGDLWIGTNGGGLNRFDVKSNIFQTFTMNDSINQSFLINDWINALEVDNNGRIWIGTFWGLSVFDPYSSHFINYKRSEDGSKDKENGISNNVIYSILETSNNEVWIGTRNGLNKFLPQSNRFEIYNKSNGLSGNIIYGIQEDGNGDLWLSTNRGLCHFNPKSLEVQNYYESDGLQSNQFFRGASYKNEFGELFFGGISGLNSFHPDSIREQYQIPKAVIIDFKIFDKTIRPGQAFDDRKIISKPISLVKEIHLKHRDNSFSFELSALDYILPEKTRYQCKMEGFDNDWRSMDYSQRYITYTNLNAGKYEFKYRASSIDGHWGRGYNSLTIEIDPPTYKTWWAYSLYYLLIGVLLIAIYHLTIRRVTLGAQIKLERLHREKTEELSQAKLRFFTNISHEFRTPITLITGPMEKMLADKTVAKKYGNNINMMLKNANRLLRLVNQLMDLRKVEGESMKLKVIEADLVAFIKEIHTSFDEYARQKNIDFYFHSEVEELNLWFDADKIDKILFNLLSNAFKHTPENGEIGIYLSKTLLDDEVLAKIIIKDTGKGIPAAEHDRIFERFYQSSNNNINSSGTGVGLSLTKNLIELHKGNITFESVENKGTSFTVILPIDDGIYSDEEKTYQTVIEEKIYDHKKHLPEDESAVFINDNEANLENNLSILVVEDNHDLRKYICTELAENYKIYEAENGKIGLEMAINKMPDLIISDVMMPEMDGLELCKTIKSNLITNHIPIILLTAKTSIEQRIEGIEQGADSYIPKPFHPEHLQIRAKKLIELRQTLKYKFSEQMSSVDAKPQPIEDKFLAKITDIIKANIDEADLNIEWLSAQMNISRGHLHRKIKLLTEKSPSEFVRIVKLNESLSLLRTGEYNVSEISYMVGFNSPSYFTNSFKIHFKMSPTDYVERNK